MGCGTSSSIVAIPGGPPHDELAGGSVDQKMADIDASRSMASKTVQRQPAGAVLLLAKAQTLPISLLLHMTTFLDCRDVTRMPSVCRSWIVPSHQLDLCWRPLYLRDW